MMVWFVYDNDLYHKRVKRQSHKMINHTQTIRRLSVFDYFVKLALKGLNSTLNFIRKQVHVIRVTEYLNDVLSK